jgi:translocator protein
MRRGEIMRTIGAFVFFVVCSYLPALTGFFVETGGWYAALKKPPFNPPGWVFGPVWTALYLMMGVAAWMVWRVGGFRGAGVALGVFLVQLTLNGLWTWIFFGLHRPGWALVEVAVLWLAILATLLLFRRHSALAGALLIPYLAWVSFAAVLNFALWRLNG